MGAIRERANLDAPIPWGSRALHLLSLVLFAFIASFPWTFDPVCLLLFPAGLGGLARFGVPGLLVAGSAALAYPIALGLVVFTRERRTFTLAFVVLLAVVFLNVVGCHGAKQGFADGWDP